MSRHSRVSPDGYPQHVLNRANDHKRLFVEPDDCKRFLALMRETGEEFDHQLFAYILMPTHFHLVIQFARGLELSAYMHRLLSRHVRQHHRCHGTIGRGHLYQGRFKNFVIGGERYFQTALRYVESNALRAELVERAERWSWSSLSLDATGPDRPVLSATSLPRGDVWLDYVNQPIAHNDLDTIRTSLRRGRPYGDDGWVRKSSFAKALAHTFHPTHRPPATR